MKIHLVGGFLGSGKTTAIIAAAKQLISQGKRVGVVTNDQGKYLVDTNFFQSQQIPTVEVTNGCFCCNYDNLDEKISQLQAHEKPDVIFAESVGSCGDIVATVIKPLLELSESKTSLSSFSVFADSMLLLAFLQGEELPFSENVLYIFKKQIEEANILVINKIDLLNRDEVEEITLLAVKAYPDKVIRLQNSKSEDDISKWYQLIDQRTDLAAMKPVEMDYSRYGDGEAELAWLDQEVKISVTQGNAYQVVVGLINAIVHGIAAQNATIGHLKFMVGSPEDAIKISIPTVDQKGWQDELKKHQSKVATVLINARVQMAPESLKKIVVDAIASIGENPQTNITSENMDVFKPGFPRPTHRMTGD